MMMGNQIRSSRLLFRDPSVHDVDPLTALFSDASVTRYVGSGAQWSREDVARRIDRGVELVRAGQPYFWTVERLDTGAIIGQGGLVPIEAKGPEIELGYRLGREHWGRGFASEIARVAVTCAFTSMEEGGLGLDRLVALCYRENMASRRVLAKAGFAEIGMTDAYYNAPCLFFEHKGGSS